MILSKKRITKALISLPGCAGCSAPVLFPNTRRQVFSRQGPYDLKIVRSWNKILSNLLSICAFSGGGMFDNSDRKTYH